MLPVRSRRRAQVNGCANHYHLPADLSRPGAAAALMKTVEQSGLAIDTLINNAGLGDTGRFDQENPERILSMLQVNIIALTELTRLVLPQMVARKRGKVMLLASLAAFQPGPGMAVIMQPSPTC